MTSLLAPDPTFESSTVERLLRERFWLAPDVGGAVAAVHLLRPAPNAPAPGGEAARRNAPPTLEEKPHGPQ